MNEQHDTGAIRSKLYEKGIKFPLRYDLMMCNHIGMRRVAEVFGEGCEKYGVNNWMNGFPESVMVNHCVEHLRLHLAGDVGEDHLAHALWNLFSLMYFQEQKPELMDITKASWPPKPC